MSNELKDLRQFVRRIDLAFEALFIGAGNITKQDLYTLHQRAKQLIDIHQIGVKKIDVEDNFKVWQPEYDDDEYMET